MSNNEYTVDFLFKAKLLELDNRKKLSVIECEKGYGIFLFLFMVCIIYDYK